MHITNTLIIFVITVTRTKVSSFNIETREESLFVKKSTDNTYFGFSVAQHCENSNSQDKDDYWMLVGAPLGKNLQPNTNRSGALYKCPITKDTRCTQIETDGKRSAGGRYNLEEFDYDDTPKLRNPNLLERPLNDEIKEDQWLGVTVRSQKAGGQVVVCAHRYIHSPNLTLYHYGMGLCYLLDKNLVTTEALEPCDGRPTEKLHQQFGFCQVGTSLALLEEGIVLMGAPGPYTWRGTIFAKSVVGSFLDKDKTVYKGPLNDNPTPLDKYSYLGMSVTGGHFFSKEDTTFVSGAPRSNNTGQVFFLRRQPHVEDMIIELIISGEQFGASFGYEILAVDINQDGLDELLVAAPFYYDMEGAGGAVYLYKNLQKCLSCGNVKPTSLKGKTESRFGFSMTSLGDINKDGYNDVAIGAPYEPTDGEGYGAVYIYLGCENGLIEKPSQIIKVRGIKTFGYSLSGGLDMDLNGYPDLLVGAYESDRAILYKTRPIIDIEISFKGNELKNINATQKGCAGDPNSNKTCFSFETCFSLTKFHPQGPVGIKYEIKEVIKKIPRVTFQQGSSIVNVRNSKQEYCVKEVAYLVEGTGDILTVIDLKVNFTIHDDPIDSPILNKTSVKSLNATFQKNCGSDDVCESNLVLDVTTALEKTLDGYVLNVSKYGKDKEFLLDATVTNFGEPAYEAKLFVEHPEGLSYIALNKTASVVCTASNNSTVVVCNLGNPLQQDQSVFLQLRFEVTQAKQKQLELKISVNSTSTELSKKTSQNITVILEKIASFVINGGGKPQNILYSGAVKGQSAMRNLADIGPKVIHSYDVINQGDWNIRDVIVNISWPYQVATQRPEGGKWLLYLDQNPSIDGDHNYCTVSPPNVVNMLHLESSGVEEEDLDEEVFTQPPGNVRRKRDVEERIKPETRPGPDNKDRKVVYMDCGRLRKKTARCATITCFIPQLQENSQIKINISARVWNSTLVEDYSQVDWVTIRSEAVLNIKDTLIKPSDTSIKATSVETNAYPGVVLAETGVNIWIIVGAVIAGLVLLVLVILILYKCGFFKRNRIKDHTLSANLRKQGENENLLNESESKPAKKK